MKKLLITGLALLLSCSHSVFAESQNDLNKKTVLAFYEELINQKNVDAAEKYMGKKYIQHNPQAADGVEGLRSYIQYLREQYPYSHAEIKRVFAEGNYVVLHVNTKLVPNTRGLAIVDIFRLDAGKIVEHWDVIQEVPEKSANENGMF